MLDVPSGSVSIAPAFYTNKEHTKMKNEKIKFNHQEDDFAGSIDMSKDDYVNMSTCLNSILAAMKVALIPGTNPEKLILKTTMQMDEESRKMMLKYRMIEDHGDSYKIIVTDRSHLMETLYLIANDCGFKVFLASISYFLTSKEMFEVVLHHSMVGMMQTMENSSEEESETEEEVIQ
jgi:hypothetical protein